MLTMLLMTAAVQAAPADLRPDLGWMSGYWLMCDRGEVSETWSDPRHDLMTGMGVTVRDGRASFELSRIAPADATPDAPLAYFALPEGAAAATMFPVTGSSSGRVVFEQPRDDDFPKRVVYEREGDVLNARIEGEIDGQTRIIRWRFQKADLNARCPA